MKTTIIAIITALSVICIASSAGSAQISDSLSQKETVQSGISANPEVGRDGYIYIKYNNTTSKYYRILYSYTNENGYEVKNYISAIPNTKTSVQIGKGTGCKITKYDPVD